MLVLMMYKPELPLSLYTDTSTQGKGIMLYQSDKEKHVLTFISHTLLPAETQYIVTELEAFTIVWGIEQNCHNLYGCPFKVVIDHHDLCHLMKLKNPTNRLAQWILKVQEYNFTVEYKSGKLHADASDLAWILQSFYWTDICASVYDYIKACVSCQQNKACKLLQSGVCN